MTARLLAFPATPRLTPSEPAEYYINEADRARYGERHVRFKKELGRSGGWAAVLRVGGKRGGGTMASILPVLALHAYPTDAPLRPVHPDLAPPSPAFTPWAYLSIRRIATLAGLNRNTAWRALQSLGRIGLAEHQTVSCHDVDGGRKTWFRLSRKLFAEGIEEYAAITGLLIYSGTWRVLPTSASRHLYLLLAMLDPVHSEEGLRDFYESVDGIDDTTKQIRKIREIREANAISLTTLQRLSGLSRGAVREALAVLTTPLFENGTLPLVKCGGREGGARWYAIERVATTWHWMPDYLNAHSLRKLRQDIWKELAQPKKKKSTNRRRKGKTRGGCIVGDMI